MTNLQTLKPAARRAEAEMPNQQPAMSPQLTTPAPLKGRRRKADILMAQGVWAEMSVNGRKVPYLKMPAPELQEELGRVLEASIKKHLKAGGFERICATQREHPFHSVILRDRVDLLMQDFGEAEYRSPENVEAVRRELYALAQATKASLVPFTESDADHTIARGIEANSDRVLWAKAYNLSQEILNDTYWRRTEAYQIMCPPDGPTLPEGSARPNPVYVNKAYPAIVLQFQDWAVNCYVQHGHGVVEFA